MRPLDASGEGKTGASAFPWQTHAFPVCIKAFSLFFFILPMGNQAENLERESASFAKQCCT
jgi:hypothetical protein